MLKYSDIFSDEALETVQSWDTYKFQPFQSERVEKSRSSESNMFFDISLYVEDEEELKENDNDPESSSKSLQHQTEEEPVSTGRGSSRKFTSVKDKSIASTSQKSFEPTNDLETCKSQIVCNPEDPLYKTEICKQWKDGKHCKFGKSCKYAHGIDELRDKERHKKFKTILCKKYHETGICPYGSRCSFIHDEPFLSREIKKTRLECFQKRTIGVYLPQDTSSSILPQFKHIELF